MNCVLIDLLPLPDRWPLVIDIQLKTMQTTCCRMTTLGLLDHTRAGRVKYPFILGRRGVYSLCLILQAHPQRVKLSRSRRHSEACFSGAFTRLGTRPAQVAAPTDPIIERFDRVNETGPGEIALLVRGGAATGSLRGNGRCGLDNCPRTWGRLRLQSVYICLRSAAKQSRIRRHARQCLHFYRRSVFAIPGRRAA